MGRLWIHGTGLAEGSAKAQALPISGEWLVNDL